MKAGRERESVARAENNTQRKREMDYATMRKERQSVQERENLERESEGEGGKGCDAAARKMLKTRNRCSPFPFLCAYINVVESERL